MDQHPAPDIVLDGVTKRFGDTLAVDDVSLQIPKGSFFAMLGPSGCGKTTTLRMIGGFEDPTSGRVELAGKDVTHAPPYRRDVNTVFQSYALFPHLTIERNVAFGLQQKKVPKAEMRQRVAEALELVHLQGMGHRKPNQLSGGQQQRVALARAIVFGPKALLLDEPLGALDRNLRGALQAEIRRIHREVGSTFVFVTHDQEEAMNLSDRIALFNAGRIEQVGSPEQLYREPETLFTARFLGDSNVFELDGGVTGAAVGWDGQTWAVDPATVAEHPGVLGSAAVVVRPEDVGIVASPGDVPAGANAVRAVVTDLEYMGSYRTAMLGLGAPGVRGQARIDAFDATLTRGDEVVAWWHPQRQRVVAS